MNVLFWICLGVDFVSNCLIGAIIANAFVRVRQQKELLKKRGDK